MSTTTELNQAKSPSAGLAPLYVANLVCSMGMMGFVALSAPLAATLGLSAWQIGLSATAGGLGWVLTARAWGRAADRFGRKPVLALGLGGFTLGYLGICLAAQAGAAWGLAATLTLIGLVLTRLFAGLSYAALPAAGGALIADRNAPEARAGAMAKLGAAQAAGLLFGPAVVAIAAGPSPVLPLFGFMAMALAALAYLAMSLPPDAAERADAVPPLPISDPRLLQPLGAALGMMLAIGIAQIVVGFAALDRLGLSGTEATRTAGLALAGVGVALIGAQMVVGKLGWPPARLILVGGFIAAIGFLAAAFAPSPGTLIASYAFSGFGAGWAAPAISAAAANAVGADEQGRAAGAVSTAFGVGAMTGPLLGGTLYRVAGILPFLLGALSFLAVAWIGRSMRA